MEWKATEQDGASPSAPMHVARLAWPTPTPSPRGDSCSAAPPQESATEASEWQHRHDPGGGETAATSSRGVGNGGGGRHNDSVSMLQDPDLAYYVKTTGQAREAASAQGARVAAEAEVTRKRVNSASGPYLRKLEVEGRRKAQQCTAMYGHNSQRGQAHSGGAAHAEFRMHNRVHNS